MGGKGINVARVAQEALAAVRCVLPACPQDPILGLLDQVKLPYVSTDISEAVRTNLTIIDGKGQTDQNKLNRAQLLPPGSKNRCWGRLKNRLEI